MIVKPILFGFICVIGIVCILDMAILSLIQGAVYAFYKNINPFHLQLDVASNNSNKKFYPYITSQNILINNDNAPNTSKNFNFNYTKSGGIFGETHTISYNSKTNELFSNNKYKSSNKQLSTYQKREIEDVITKNKDLFLKTMLDYPPSKSAVDYFSYKLSIELNNNLYRISWTDASPVAPHSLFNIRDIIEKIADNP